MEEPRVPRPLPRARAGDGRASGAAHRGSRCGHRGRRGARLRWWNQPARATRREPCSLPRCARSRARARQGGGAGGAGRFACPPGQRVSVRDAQAMLGSEGEDARGRGPRRPPPGATRQPPLRPGEDARVTGCPSAGVAPSSGSGRGRRRRWDHPRKAVTSRTYSSVFSKGRRWPAPWMTVSWDLGMSRWKSSP